MEITLVGRRAQGRTVLIDDKDYELVAGYRWHLWDGRKNGKGGPYAMVSVKRDGKWTKIAMHKLLTGNALTDHRNGNGLDNRRENLRPATPGQNKANAKTWGRSHFRGVSWSARAKKWQAQVHKAGERRYHGFFEAEEDAARAYDKAAIEIHGEFARPNFPVGGY